MRGLTAWLALALGLLTVSAYGQPNQSLAGLLERHRANPDNAEVCHRIGIAYLNAEKLEDAAAFFRKAVALAPSFVAARKNLATVLWFLGLYGESEREFQTVLRQSPKDPVPHLYIGLAELGRKRFLSARQHFVQAGPLASDNPEALPAVLEAHLATGDKTFAAGVIEKFRQASRPDPELSIRLAGVMNRYGMYRYSVTLLEGIAGAQPGKEAALLLLAEAYDKQNRPGKAYELFVKAIDHNPSAEQPYLALADFAAAHGNAAYAHKTLARGLETIPGSPRLILQQGILWAIEGNREKAMERFSAAATTDPKWNVPVLAKGILELEAGNAGAAAAAFRKAAVIAPRDHQAEYLYATALSRSSGRARQDEIVTALHRALALKPDDSRSALLLGQTLLAQGDVKAGTVQLEKALRLDPENTTAQYQLAVAYQKQGRKAEARKLFDRFRQSKAKQREEESVQVQLMRIIENKSSKTP
ncbi:MAG: tetratricopeptide repeat protein [Bryobacteraceae bacterium]|nr:tetratricopeptide repeat protein [Bryobacterales bacterium]NUN02230.1 tetratricopeptide repeat protein [Bryobacteraceae bacterium]